MPKLKVNFKKQFGRDLGLPSWNSSLDKKVELRHWILETLAVSNPRILDCYCGPGGMWEKAYSSTSNYVGLDKTLYRDSRTTLVCENVDYLKSADLDQFDVFDLDAFGSPMEALAITCNRIRWKSRSRIGIVLTDGTGLNAKLNATSVAYVKYLGISRHRKTPIQNKERDTFLKMCIYKAVQEADAHIEAIKVYAKAKGAAMRYIGLILSHGQPQGGETKGP